MKIILWALLLETTTTDVLDLDLRSQNLWQPRMSYTYNGFDSLALEQALQEEAALT